MSATLCPVCMGMGYTPHSTAGCRGCNTTGVVIVPENHYHGADVVDRPEPARDGLADYADHDDLEGSIRRAINRASAENGSDTPDFILARYLMACLEAFNDATTARTHWYTRRAPTAPDGTES